MGHNWEPAIIVACDKTGSVCAHSRHAPNGNRYNFDMECRFSSVPDRRLIDRRGNSVNLTILTETEPDAWVSLAAMIERELLDVTTIHCESVTRV